ncbi:MAG: ATP-binding protein [Alphaproteobacteria bacterium]|nr:ATP-binding protein [Alphaproteobacteria bacterium]
MSQNVSLFPRRIDPAAIDERQVLGALTSPVLVIDAEGIVVYANGAAEQFFQMANRLMLGRPLRVLVYPDNPMLELVDRARVTMSSLSLHGIEFETPRTEPHQLTAEASAIPDSNGQVVLTLHERSVAMQIQKRFNFRNAARSVTAMAAMLAHEVKNPLSGIRGAAQLLGESVSDEDRSLAELIQTETDRIVALVDQMEAFSDDRPIQREPVNIHIVLEYVRKVSENGFGRRVRFVERYDPSLPPVMGNRDLLIQVFLNLVKNACEACPEEGGAVEIVTAYRPGLRLNLPGGGEPIDLPLTIAVRDNGPGVPPALAQNLFDPFVTGKPNGRGLGLAFVAKAVGDHGGLIEHENTGHGAEFRVMLPTARPAKRRGKRVP